MPTLPDQAILRIYGSGRKNEGKATSGPHIFSMEHWNHARSETVRSARRSGGAGKETLVEEPRGQGREPSTHQWEPLPGMEILLYHELGM